MLNNPVLDIFIGLVFVYLLYSLLATVLQEMTARWLSIRTHNLTYAIRVMLEDRAKLKHNNLASRCWDALRNAVYHFFVPFPKDTFSKAFYTHPAIKYLGESQLKRRPAYIYPETFSQTLIQLLREDDFDASRSQISLIEDVLFRKKSFNAVIAGEKIAIPIDEETLRHLKNIFMDSHRDIDRFKALLEGWFNETMDRAAGWYKRTVQLMLLIIGFALARGFNIDTIAIYKLLAVNRPAREQMVQLAIANEDKYGAIINKLGPLTNGEKYEERDTATGKAVMHIRDTILISDSTLKDAMDTVKSDAKKAENILSASAEYQGSCCSIFLGWLITALAISLGAPFWFDLLSKLVKLRSTGPKPEDSAPESSSKQDISAIKRVG